LTEVLVVFEIFFTIAFDVVLSAALKLSFIIVKPACNVLDVPLVVLCIISEKVLLFRRMT
jgi:hypothetical protein